MEIYVPYRPVAARIEAETRHTFVLLLGGLAALWATLFRIVAGASRRLREQAAGNRHQALHDALTGLPNRALFRDRTAQALLTARRDVPLPAKPATDAGSTPAPTSMNHLLTSEPLIRHEASTTRRQREDVADGQQSDATAYIRLSAGAAEPPAQA